MHSFKKWYRDLDVLDFTWTGRWSCSLDVQLYIWSSSTWLLWRDVAPDAGTDMDIMYAALVGDRWWGECRGDDDDGSNKLLMLLLRLSEAWCCRILISISFSANSACIVLILVRNIIPHNKIQNSRTQMIIPLSIQRCTLKSSNKKHTESQSKWNQFYNFSET